MKKLFAFSFFTLGFSSLIAQVVIIRELIISFYGNELFIGWVLFSWLFWTGLGSLVLSRFFKNASSVFGAFFGCHLSAAILFPLVILLIRSGKIILGSLPGEVPNLIPSLGFSFLALAPFCMILGLQFAAVTRARFFRGPNEDPGQVMGHSYLYETLGFAAGGLLFTYGLVFANEILIASILAFINLICALWIVRERLLIKRALPVILISAAFLLILIISFGSGPINKMSFQWRMPGERLLETRNSLYGNIAVSETRGQNNIYENGLLLGPARDKLASELLVHFPMLAQKDPRTVLLLGTGFNGALKELLQYPVARIVNVELDPAIIKTAEKYLPPDLRSALKDKRVVIYAGDARAYLKTNRDKYDVVIVNLPNPSTALINRCFTDEFFAQIRLLLNPGGLVATHLAFSPNYLKPELEDLAASLYKTLGKHFPSLLVLPEDTIYYLASLDPAEKWKPEVFAERFRTRDPQTQFVTLPYIEYRLTNDRVQAVKDQLEQNQSAEINQDLVPKAYYYNLVYWVSIFYLGLAHGFGIFSRIPFIALAGVLFALLFLVVIPLRKKRETVILNLAMAVSGFSLLGAEIIILYVFQVLFGNLYYKIALLISGMMIGMAVGTWLAMKYLHQIKRTTMVKIHLAEVIYFLLFMNLMTFDRFQTEGFFLISAGLIGAIVGFEFPALNRLLLAQEGSAASRTGVIYAADLLGSSLGAVLISVFTLPIYGVTKTLFLLCLLNLAMALFFIFRKNLGRKDV